ncbi:hypothetical protein KOAAANKH_03697 [Brevundimonas sp. NIBR10]|uniref:DUF6999 family protein n=1 Tax=Brevundimonas sp. NIBR10 TaxID=3015997 RepID=UPI0022F17F4F|nr:hypothetical protein [Brevundimonas sp. NIBR10]WGM48790.1 hypothetical protein KOAAANKH_03697 [Brevundimonas sp. NIBR10]
MSLSDGGAHGDSGPRERADPFDARAYDPADPDPWLALYLDHSLPIDPQAKRALLLGARSWSRRWLFPVSRPLVFLFFCVVKVLRAISPRHPNLNGLLHKSIRWGLQIFGSPEANTLILRHFHIGTELLAFMKANCGVDPGSIKTIPLKPLALKDLEDNVFLQHDLNIFNFIIEMNIGLQAQGRELTPPAVVDFSMISDVEPAFQTFPTGPLNRIDIQTAVEFYTPLYALMLPRADFMRASHSLQLDETVAIYIARILGTDYHMNFVKNGHPLVTLSTLQAGYRLMMHGLDCEGMHGWLRVLKARQAAGLSLDPRNPTGGETALA